MSKKLDEEITTVENFNYATQNIKSTTQIYVIDENSGALVEITEIQLILPKSEEEPEPFLVLRTA